MTLIDRLSAISKLDLVDRTISPGEADILLDLIEAANQTSAMPSAVVDSGSHEWLRDAVARARAEDSQSQPHER